MHITLILQRSEPDVVLLNCTEKSSWRCCETFILQSYFNSTELLSALNIKCASSREACFNSHNQYAWMWGGVSCSSAAKHARLTDCIKAGNAEVAAEFIYGLEAHVSFPPLNSPSDVLHRRTWQTSVVLSSLHSDFWTYTVKSPCTFSHCCPTCSVWGVKISLLCFRKMNPLLFYLDVQIFLQI